MEYKKNQAVPMRMQKRKFLKLKTVINNDIYLRARFIFINLSIFIFFGGNCHFFSKLLKLLTGEDIYLSLGAHKNNEDSILTPSSKEMHL